MRFAIVSLALVCASLAEACPPAPSPPPAPDASDGGGPPPVSDAAPSPTIDAGSSPAAKACANLASLQCAEGVAPNCVATVEHAQADRITDLHLDCLIAAKSKAAARACKSVSCP